MSVNMTEKQKLIQQLLAAKTKAYQVELKLLLKRKPEEANKVKLHGKELSRKIDYLIGESMSDWLGESVIIIEDVKSINKKMQRSIKDIQDDVNLTKNVVKIVGLIDDVVEIVGSIA